ncbi:MAG TPA: hypothetical protein VFU28_21840 [Vicinamibacterales bacterium]|nr:hypothetical protein [Vicinamibacterales bacterium]
MFGTNVNLLQMNGARLEQQRVREPHRKIICECNPQMTLPLGAFQIFDARCFSKNCFRSMAYEKAGGITLHCCQQR